MHLLARARALGAEVIRSYAPATTAPGTRSPSRHSLQIVEIDRFLLLEVDQQLRRPSAGPDVRDLASEAAGSEREAWQLEQALHAALDTSAPYVPETFAEWRARVLEAPGSGPETVLVTRGPDGEMAGICALRVCTAQPETVYHAFTGVAESVRGQGHGRALKQRRDPPGARAGRPPAGGRHESRQHRHADAQRAPRLRPRARRPQPRRGPVSEFRIDLRVRFAETDAMGVAHHAAYLPYLETARVEYLRALGHPYRDLRDRDGLEFAVVGRRRALPRAAALRRRVHGQLRTGRARAGDLQPGLPRRARPRSSSSAVARATPCSTARAVLRGACPPGCSALPVAGG